MQRELVLAGGFAAVVVAAALLAALTPGALASPGDDVRRGYVDLRDMSVAHGDVGGETVELAVEARLQHDGGPSENVTVEFRAVSTRSGLVETTETVDVGTVSGEREVSVPATLTVERAGGYRIEAVVYEDGERRSEGRTVVEGVDALTPAYARTSVEFHQFGGAAGDLPVIEYAIQSTGDNRTTLNVSTYLTNTGDGPSENLRLVLKARQADSNIVAAERTVRVGEIGPGSTATPTTTLTVPSRYNYYLDAVLWKDGVIVGTARSAASLDPTETISVNQTRRDVGLRVEDFERGREGEAGGTPAPAGGATDVAGPGFGVGAALAALLVAVLALARGGGTDD